MKFIILAFVIAAVSAAPTQITDNNVGDIVNVNVDADLNLKNQIDFSSFDLDVIYKNLQVILLGLGGVDRPNNDPPQWPLPREITPEMVSTFLKAMSENK